MRFIHGEGWHHIRFGIYHYQHGGRYWGDWWYLSLGRLGFFLTPRMITLEIGKPHYIWWGLARGKGWA